MTAVGSFMTWPVNENISPTQKLTNDWIKYLISSKLIVLLLTSTSLFPSLCWPCASTVSTEGPPSCPKGCDRCSEYNGCIKCKPKLFIFLERNDIRQIGVCLASCPVGYFGMRNPEGNNRCTREFCFVLETLDQYVDTLDLTWRTWRPEPVHPLPKCANDPFVFGSSSLVCGQKGYIQLSEYFRSEKILTKT